MTISKNTALKLWNDVFGDNIVWARDCFGTWIHKEDYGDTERVRIRPNGDGEQHIYGWTIDHIFPVAKGGKDVWNNYEPMHFVNNNEKKDKTSFVIGNTPYQVVKCNLCPGYGYGIQTQQTKKRVDWKGVQQRWYV